uniref:Uncharacterized protein n=1 Tax=Globisporangium ultimum (strain ATCC 200006 / CBS 805.95 / DAOM BR144) TaxID=431595 RepID=K3WQK2_GLOUD
MRTFSGENNVEMRRFAAEVFGAMGDIIMNKIQLSYSTPQGSGHLQLRTVMRHIVHAERSVFVAVRFYDNVHFEGQLVDGFVLHECKWTVLENDADVCDATAACKATRIQAYSKVGPESTVLPTPTNWDCETLQNIVAPAWTMATSIAQRRVESILLAQATA